MNKKTHEQFLQELEEVRSDVEILGTYSSSKERILTKCKVCGYEWHILPHNLLKGRKCPECKKDVLKNAHSKTHGQYIKDILEKGLHVFPLEKYRGANINIMHICIDHEVEWSAKPYNILNGNGCKICRGEKIRNASMLSQEEYLKKLEEKNPLVKPLEEYKGANIKILHKCLVCEHVWSVSPASVTMADTEFNRCPECARNKARQQKQFSTDQYKQKLKELDPDVICTGEYNGMHTPVSHECLRCGYVWESTPSTVLHRKRNKACTCCSSNSKYEKGIVEFLQKYNVKFIAQKTFPDLIGEKGRMLRYDFFLPEHNLIIEYHDRQHTQEVELWDGEEGFEKRLEYDRLKESYAKRNGYDFLVIWYYEYKWMEEILLKKMNIDYSPQKIVPINRTKNVS